MHGSGPLQAAVNVGQIITVGYFLTADEFNRRQIAPRVRKKIVRRRYAKLRLADAMLARAGIQESNGQPVIARKKECPLDAFQIGGFDIRIQLAQLDG